MTAMQRRLAWLRRLGVAAVLYAGAAAVGLGSAWWVLKKAPWIHNSVQAGAWRADMHAGSQDANMYTRASIALNALLALDRSETMYFIAAKDDTGNTLRSRCNYRVTGTPPDARWWSITAYADDMFLFDIAKGNHSLNGSTAVLDLDGRFALTAGSTEYPGTYWLAANGNTAMVLTLRLYNPSPQLQAAPGTLRAPSIVPVGVCE